MIIIVHYKELALKGRNRPWFIQRLVRNLKTALTGLQVKSVRSIMGRIEIQLSNHDSRLPNPVWDEARQRIRRVFGIANFSVASRGPHDFDELSAAILRDLGERQASSFRFLCRVPIRCPGRHANIDRLRPRTSADQNTRAVVL